MSTGTQANLKTCIVEVADQPVGILQQTRHGYVFSSVDATTAKLDGRCFASVARAIRNAQSCVNRESARNEEQSDQ